MSEFFKPEDFSDSCGYGFHPDTLKHLAGQANAKLKAHLDGLPVVYGHLYDHGRIVYEEQKFWNDTHRARLWGIEEIKPKECEHEPGATNFNLWQSACCRCGVKLKAKWEAVE